MTEETVDLCKYGHYPIEKTEDDTHYCKKCSAILLEEKYWAGEITFGKMSKNFEENGAGLDFSTLIAGHVGTRPENIIVRKVWGVEGKWYPEIQVHFSLTGSSAVLTANISYNRSTRYLPTGGFFVAPEVAEDLTSDS